MVIGSGGLDRADLSHNAILAHETRARARVSCAKTVFGLRSGGFLSDLCCTFPHMLIDCDECLMRETNACSDCVVSFLLSEEPVDLDSEEQAALGTLADAGLVPRLRLIKPDRRAG